MKNRPPVEFQIQCKYIEPLIKSLLATIVDCGGPLYGPHGPNY